MAIIITNCPVSDFVRGVKSLRIISNTRRDTSITTDGLDPCSIVHEYRRADFFCLPGTQHGKFLGIRLSIVEGIKIWWCCGRWCAPHMGKK
jgi:hypothetical protein